MPCYHSEECLDLMNTVRPESPEEIASTKWLIVLLLKSWCTWVSLLTELLLTASFYTKRLPLLRVRRMRKSICARPDCWHNQHLYNCGTANLTHHSITCCLSYLSIISIPLVLEWGGLGFDWTSLSNSTMNRDEYPTLHTSSTRRCYNIIYVPLAATAAQVFVDNLEG